MKIDMVKPIPPRQASTNIWRQAIPSGSGKPGAHPEPRGQQDPQGFAQGEHEQDAHRENRSVWHGKLNARECDAGIGEGEERHEAKRHPRVQGLLDPHRRRENVAFRKLQSPERCGRLGRLLTSPQR